MQLRPRRIFHHATASAVPDALALPPSPVRQATNELAGLPPSHPPSFPPLLRRQSPFFFGYWNVRTMRTIETQTLTMRTLNEYNIDVACLSEVRIPQSGRKTIKVPQAEKTYNLYYSGVSDNSGLHGVAFALSNKASASLLEWEPISPRLARIRLRGSVFNISVFSVYAPTNDSSETEKDNFYAALQTAVSRVPSSDMLIMAGDWNARPGRNDETSRRYLGNFSIGNRCPNGDRMLDFAVSNSCVLTSTRFRHPDNHLVTWYSNDGVTKAQIDHMLVRSRWASCVLDCRAYRGAETGHKSGSDHTLVRAKLALRLKTLRNKPRPAILDIGQLRKPSVRDEFRLQLQNRFEALSSIPEESSIDQTWQSVKSCVQETAVSVLGNKKRPTKDWISAETIQLADNAKQAKAANDPTFRELRRATGRSARNDRNAYWSEIATAMENAAAVGDSRKLYQLLKSTSKGTSVISEAIYDEHGTLITAVEARNDRWKQHFESLLNHPPITLPLPRLPPQPEYECDVEAPSQSEIDSVINSLRNNKAPGQDGIPAEVYKSATGIASPWLHEVIAQVWRTESVPQDWRDAVIVPFHKKGDKKSCANYRGISLTDVAAKIFAILLLRRFHQQRDARTRPNQAGFRPGRGSIDQIFCLRRTLEHRWSYQQPTVVCFIDFAAAFDSINRSAIWQIMEADGIPKKLLNLIKSYYESTRSKVRCYNTTTDLFEIVSGVRQGCPLSPTIFNYAIDFILGHALEGFPGVQLSRSVVVKDLDYADDIAIFGASYLEVQSVIDQIAQVSALVGLKINSTKTKVMSAGIPAQDTVPITLGGTALEEVSSFSYLGSTVTPNGQSADDVTTRINKAHSAFGRLQRCLWSRSEIRRSTKMRIYQALVRSILLYGCETWAMRASDIHKVDVFDRNCVRRILHIRPLDYVSNESLYHRAHLRPLSQEIHKRRLRWFGHALRRPVGQGIRDVIDPKPPSHWKKRQGGQFRTWLSTVKMDMERGSGPAVYGLRRWNREWVEIAATEANNRQAWSAFVRDQIEALEGAGSTHPG